MHHTGNQAAVTALFIHGIPGDRVDAHRLPVRIARALCANGVNAIRIDLYASGISQGDFSKVTLSSQKEQLKQVIQYIRNHLCLTGPLILIAFSEGAKLAVSLFHETKDIYGLCFCNGILAEENPIEVLKIKKLYKRDGVYVGNIGFGVWLNNTVFSEIKEYSLKSVEHLPLKRSLFIYGDNDIMTSNSQLMVKDRAPHIRIINGADHLFTCSRFDSLLIQYICEWITDISKQQ